MKHRPLIDEHGPDLALVVGRELRNLEKDRLAAYLELLAHWNRTHNLVGDGTAAEWLRRHLVDSLAGAPHLGVAGGVLVDLGSGAGLPGIPLIAVSPGWAGILVEPRQKRWAFLKAVVRELGLDAEVLGRRYQEWSVPERAGTRVIVSRALGDHEEILRWAAPQLTGEGDAVLLWLGENDARTVADLPGWRVVGSPLPTLERGRLIHATPCST